MERANELAPGSNEPLAIYRSIVFSLQCAFIRLQQARIAFMCSQVALQRLHSMPSPTAIGEIDEHLAKVISSLQLVKHSDYESFDYVVGASLLVYAATIFETFLNDTTTFLLVLHPASIGTSSVSIRDLLEGTKSSALNDAIRKKVRALSYESFRDRLDIISKNYGLSLDFSESETISLKKTSALRNEVVHDQSAFTISLTEDGTPYCARTACVARPKPVTFEQLDEALTIFGVASYRLAASIMNNVLKNPDDQILLEAKTILHREADPTALLDAAP